MRAALSVLAMALLAGCTTSGGGGAPLIPDKAIPLTSAVKVTLAGAVSGGLVLGAIHQIYDPLAPNWEIDEVRLADDTFRFALKMKRYHTGGSGESIQAVRRRATQLQGELGYGGYQLLGFSEGIESETLGARRVAEGTIRLVKREAADSFLQN